MNAQRVKLNIVPGGVPPIVHVSQYDVGRTLEFALYDGVGIAEIESGTSIDIRGTKPDNMGFSYPCTYSGNVVSIATREQMTAVSGSFDCELHLVKDTQDIGTANFILEVEPAALHEDTVISESELPAIVEAARNTGLTTEAVQELVASASASADSATAAANSATAAASSASSAASSATDAENSAINASNSDRSAWNSKQSAEAAANSALKSMDEAKASARQALENATGATEFSGSDPGLVPRSTKTGAFLRSDGKWDDTLATDDDITALRTSFQNGVDTVYNAVVAKGVTPSSSTPSAIATAIGGLLSPYNNIEVLYERYQTEGYLGQTPRAYKFLIMQGKNCTIDDGTIILNHTYDADSYNIKVAKDVPANTWLESESYSKKHFQCAIGIIN